VKDRSLPLTLIVIVMRSPWLQVGHVPSSLPDMEVIVGDRGLANNGPASSFRLVHANGIA
jgi:hypothetical protein